MPLYEYQCEKCGAVIEKIQKLSDPPLKRCAECGGKLERLLSSPAIQFKGTGWYITDYARKSSPEAKAKTEGGDAAKPAESKKSKPSEKSEPSPVTK